MLKQYNDRFSYVGHVCFSPFASGEEIEVVSLGFIAMTYMLHNVLIVYVHNHKHVKLHRFQTKN